MPRVEPPVPPDLEPHVLRDVPPPQIYPYLNLQMLYGKHLGLRGLVSRLLEDGDPKARELHEVVEALKAEAARERLLRADGVYRWFRARAESDTLRLFGSDSSGDPLLQRLVGGFLVPADVCNHGSLGGGVLLLLREGILRLLQRVGCARCSGCFRLKVTVRGGEFVLEFRPIIVREPRFANKALSHELQ